MPDNDVSVSALYKIKKYDVQFVDDAGKADFINPQEYSGTYDIHSSIEYPEVSCRPGYTWNCNPQEIDDLTCDTSVYLVSEGKGLQLLKVGISGDVFDKSVRLNGFDNDVSNTEYSLVDNGNGISSFTLFETDMMDESFKKTYNMLSSLNLDSCKYIGSSVFNTATICLSSLELPEIEHIGDYNFSYCTCGSLTSISFGQKLSSIGLGNFSGIKNTNITLTIDDGNPYFYVNSNTNMIYSKKDKDSKGKGLIDACLLKQEIIDDDTDCIRMYAAHNNQNAKSVSSTGCKAVECSAFYNCNKLQHLSLPSVSSIGEYAFFETAISGNENQVLKFDECLSVGDYSFNNKTVDTTFTAIRLPKCQTIGEYAFGNSTGDGVYSSRKKYTNVYIPSCLSIGYRAFNDIVSPSNCSFYMGYAVPKLIHNGSEETTTSNFANYIHTGVTLVVPEGSLDAYKQKFKTTNYNYKTWNPEEENKNVFKGYKYQKDTPKSGDATILRMTISENIITNDAVIPEQIEET